MRRRKWEVTFALAIIALAFGRSLNFVQMGWLLDDNGLSVVSGKMPYWDFSNLWAGGKLAAQGLVSHLFDVAQYRADLKIVLSPHLQTGQEWSYPPSILLLAYPLSLLPIFPAYLSWTVGTALLFLLSLRMLRLPWTVCAIVALSPAAMVNVTLGQNGALTTALLFLGLSLAQKRPLLAGCLFGLLTVKPHLGILVPICLLASGNYRAIASAAITTIALGLATGILFGFDTWLLFWSETRPLMTAILEAPYPQDYQGNALSFFIMARWLGLDVYKAYVFQSVFTVLAAVTTFWLWTRDDRLDPQLRICATALLTCLASPYGYTYDALALSAAIALLFLHHRKPNVFLLAVAWVFPPLNQSIPFSVGIIVPTLITLSMLRHVHWQPAERSERASLKAS
jgi:hypothetical protein